jgi:hypothetical protein
MGYFLFFLLGAVVAGGMIWVMGKRPSSTLPTSPNPSYDKEGNQGFGAVNEKRKQEKQASKDKIMELAGRQKEISNDDAEKLLGVSDASATNYLQELEQEGKLEQVGQEGRFVRYRVKING